MRRVDVGVRALWMASIGLLGACADPEARDPVDHAVAALAEQEESAAAASEPSAVPSESDANCNKAEPKDTLIAELVQESWRAKYPLTALSVDEQGQVVGGELPPALISSLELINSVPEARESVARALRKVSGLPAYGMLDTGPDVAWCEAVMAWAPDGPVVTSTSAFWVHTDGVNEESWRTAHKEFGKECPLVKTIGNRDIVDPPGDGSTNLPPSSTVSATGVRANAFGLCPSGTPTSTYCKLSYATGINWTGRACTPYYGSLRCLVK